MADATERAATKKQRVRVAFAETAADIIRTGGVEAATVRRIAADTGYTLATLYKYYDSLDELLWAARSRIVIDVATFTVQHGRRVITSWSELNDELRSFIRYFTDHPPVYRFLYSYRLDPEKKPSGPDGSDDVLVAAMAPVVRFLSGLASQATIPGNGPPDTGVQAALTVISFTLMGLLSVHFGGNDSMNMDTMEKSIDTLCMVMEDFFKCGRILNELP